MRNRFHNRFSARAAVALLTSMALLFGTSLVRAQHGGHGGGHGGGGHGGGGHGGGGHGGGGHGGGGHAGGGHAGGGHGGGGHGGGGHFGGGHFAGGGHAWGGHASGGHATGGFAHVQPGGFGAYHHAGGYRNYGANHFYGTAGLNGHGYRSYYGGGYAPYGHYGGYYHHHGFYRPYFFSAYNPYFNGDYLPYYCSYLPFSYAALAFSPYYSGLGFGAFPYVAGYGYDNGPAVDYGATVAGYGGAYAAPSDTAQQQNPPPTDRPPLDDAAHLQLTVPENAEVWFDGVRTTQTGAVREFVSPTLAPGSLYSYKITIRSTDAQGKAVEDTRDIRFRANDWFSVDFTRPPPVPQAPPPAATPLPKAK